MAPGSYLERVIDSSRHLSSPTSLAGQLLGLVVVSWVLYISCLTTYNLFFHPLRRFPGPKLWAASRIPYTRNELGGQSHKTLLELHKTYGPFVRIAPEILSISQPGAANDLKGHRKGGKPEHEKDPFTHSSNTGNIIGANREDHKRYRRAMAHGFSAQAMMEQQATIKQYVDLLFKRIYEAGAHGQKSVDMVAWYNYTTFDIIGDLAFGESFDCLESATYHAWISILFSSIKQLAFVRSITRYPFGNSLKKFLIPKKLIEGNKEHQALSKLKLRKRLSAETERPDFIGKMIQPTGKTGQELTFDELASNAAILIIAGSETTATLLSGATYLLASHRDALSKLTEEVRAAFSTEDEIDLVSTQNLKYMQAVLEESLRFFPPAATGQPRRVGLGGDDIGGEFIPEGTQIEIPQWATNHNPSYFSLPDEFIPERWLGDERFNNDVPEVMQVFSVGPRNCIGRNLAYAEMRLIMARMVWNFDITLAEDSQNWMETNELFILWDNPPLNVYLTPHSSV